MYVAQNIRNTKYPQLRLSIAQNIRSSEYPKFRIFGAQISQLQLRISVTKNIRNSEYSQLRIFVPKNILSSGYSKLSISVAHNIQNSQYLQLRIFVVLASSGPFPNPAVCEQTRPNCDKCGQAKPREGAITIALSYRGNIGRQLSRSRGQRKTPYVPTPTCSRGSSSLLLTSRSMFLFSYILTSQCQLSLEKNFVKYVRVPTRTYVTTPALINSQAGGLFDLKSRFFRITPAFLDSKIVFKKRTVVVGR